MDSRDMETLIQRLVLNPHDEEALRFAHQAGGADPRAYAVLLEQVGERTTDPAYAAHWLNEAAAVWATTLGDAHRAAHVLMIAIERDPTHRGAAERLAQLYRDKGDQKAVVALLERLVKALTPLLNDKPDVRSQLAALHEELGRLWGEPPLARPERALENWRRLLELDAQNVFAIYSAREIHKAQQQYADALPYFALEQALVDDPERKLALFRDEAELRKRSGDGAGAVRALREARSVAPADVGLMQELGVAVIELLDEGKSVASEDKAAGAAAFIQLGETYDGEYGLSYAQSALRIEPGNDRAMQLADHYAKRLGRAEELRPQYTEYLRANPNGFMAGEAVRVLGAVPPPPPTPLPPPERVSSSAGRPVAPASAPAQVERGSQGAQQPSPLERPSASQPSPVVPLVERGSASVPSPAAGDLRGLLEEAQAESQKGRKPQAFTRYREALQLDPANPEALSWVEDYLRQKRMYAELRDVLLGASRVPSVSAETRKAQLRDVAGLCESQLRDIDTAIVAWKQICQIDRGDEQAKDQLRRLLEKANRWDDLAMALEQEAMSAPDVEHKITLEKKLAALHDTKRKDPVAAGEAWARVAILAAGDETIIQTAVKLFERGERLDLAADVILENVANVEDESARASLQEKLGELRLKAGDAGGAGDAFQESARIRGTAKAWEAVEKAFVEAGRLSDAAAALDQRAELVSGREQAALLAQAADLYGRANDPSEAIARLERAVDLDPTSDPFSAALATLYRTEGRQADLVTFLLRRAEKLTDKARRVEARRAAAGLQRSLGDSEGARESLLLLLQDGDDPDALAELVTDAEQRGDYGECANLLRRLGAVTNEPLRKLDLALREATLYAQELSDPDGAVARYEAILSNLDAKSRAALRAIADIEAGRDNAAGQAGALERELDLADGEERVEIASRLAQLYESPLDDPRRAIRALEIVHEADPEDYDAIARLERLAELVEDWPRVATLKASLIEVEGDEEEASRMTLRLAEILGEKLGKGDEALAALERLADQGDEPSRDAYVTLGDSLGWKGVVATKLVSWHESSSGPERTAALRGAFDRFLEIGRDADATRVAMELARSRHADPDVATRLEELAVRTKDLDALSVAHEILVKELSGPDRARELVRQAEVQLAAGVEPAEAMRHGETGLTSVPPGEVEPLLGRLAALTQAPGHVIDLYERQVGRCRVPADRLAALSRAAQVAAQNGAMDRARGFFELSLAGGVQEDTLLALETAARTGDTLYGGTTLRSLLADALAAGGQGSRDGGRTRAALLRRAANLALVDLGDVDRAFKWLGDALVTHVDDAALDSLSELGERTADMGRVEATLGRALEEVFDGPLVRKLLQRRAKLRRETLGDARGAATDLKKLHDLSPSDQDVMSELSALLQELGDHRGMIQLYEDQILRGRDPAQRAELARRVARLWEENIGDAREATDAWRRVLRMKAGDPEATQGLERAKAGNLKRPPPVPVTAHASPIIHPPTQAARVHSAPPAPDDSDTSDQGPHAAYAPDPGSLHVPQATDPEPYAADPYAPGDPLLQTDNYAAAPPYEEPAAAPAEYAHPGYTQPVDPYAAQGYAPPDPYAHPGYAQPADPYAQPVDPYSQPVDPYSQPVDPYSQPVDPYSQPVDPYAQPAGGYAQPGYPAPPATYDAAAYAAYTQGDYAPDPSAEAPAVEAEGVEERAGDTLVGKTEALQNAWAQVADEDEDVEEAALVEDADIVDDDTGRFRGQ
jgi:Tfp pilus assembly protein PilF